MNRYVKFLLNPGYRFKVFSKLGLLNSMDDETYIRKLFKYEMNKELDLRNPQTYNEKLQWLKLHDRNPKYTALVDKYEVKTIVGQQIGEEYIIPTLGIWNNFEEIDFEKLPNQFVLKCTHDSGGVVVCKDKRNFDYKKARKIINNSLKRNFYYTSREWPYKDVKPRILAEKYLEDSKVKELRDYKFFCFNGKAKILYIASDRQNSNVETKFDFFDISFKHLNIINGHPNADSVPMKPIKFDEMIKLSEMISSDLRHVRVDFYEVEGRIYFGELTFFHMSGIVPFKPEEWDYKIGEWLKLPIKEGGDCE